MLNVRITATNWLSLFVIYLSLLLSIWSSYSSSYWTQISKYTVPSTSFCRLLLPFFVLSFLIPNFCFLPSIVHHVLLLPSLFLYEITDITSISPPPSFIFSFLLSRASGSLPETVVVEDNKLTVRKVDDAVNTTFICEVKNKHGASRHQLTTFVIGESVNTHTHNMYILCTLQEVEVCTDKCRWHSSTSMYITFKSDHCLHILCNMLMELHSMYAG